jgi:uncharacterized membrane protein YtjA (UPF0391 family)
VASPGFAHVDVGWLAHSLLNRVRRRDRRQISNFGSIISEVAMLHWAAVFFVIALIAALFGFGGIAAGAASIAKVLFVLFIILAIVALIMGRRAPI